MTEEISYLIPFAAIGFIGLVVGALVGFLVTGLRGGSRTAKPKRNRDLVEIIRVWHDRRSGELSMEIGGKSYKKASELNEKSLRGFMVLINELQSWLGIPDINQRLGDITSRPPQVSAPQPTKTTPLGSYEGSRTTPSTSTLQLPVTPIAEKEKELPLIGVDDKMPVVDSLGIEPTDVRSRLAVEKSKEKPKGKPKEPLQELKSIATQVDEILQEKLARSPYKDRVVRLLELPSRGMVVVVNGTQFDGVGEVPDPEVRQIIQESVAEWERRLKIK